MAGGGGNEPNLTPFIDLFSVLVCFLLMSAAWLQLDTMKTSIEKPPPPDAVSPTPPPPTKKVQLAVEVDVDKVVMKQDEKAMVIANQGREFDKSRVKNGLDGWRRSFPDRRDVVLNTGTGVRYGEMISMYDLLIAEGWPDVGINPQ